jgi:pyruvate dehydrogenase E2 component (dihydrolipoamide acetyltransferase)
MARLGIDPHSLHGTGPGGRIVEADVLGHQPASQVGGAVREPSKMRRAIARRTSAAAAVPHFYLRAEIDAAALAEARQQLLPVVEAACGVRLSLTDLLLRALARALRDCPEANTVWQDDALVTLPSPAVGLVVGLADGLLVPVLDAADQLDLSALARRRAGLVAAAREGKLSADALRVAATSLNNLGHTRVDDFLPVLSPPQSTMLAVGRLAVRPFVTDGRLAARPTLRLALAVDHRVLDGEPAARFLGRIVDYLEHPGRMLGPADRENGGG